MKPLSPKQAFAHFVVEQMAAFAPVQARAMFGGFGIARDGLTFALIINEQLYFKADELSRDEFIARGLAPFTYEARGQIRTVGYYAAPPEVFDSPDEMAAWARKGYACAVRHNQPRPRTSRTPRTSARRGR